VRRLMSAMRNQTWDILWPHDYISRKRCGHTEVTKKRARANRSADVVCQRFCKDLVLISLAAGTTALQSPRPSESSVCHPPPMSLRTSGLGDCVAMAQCCQ
jgi:hypothetical protein